MMTSSKDWRQRLVEAYPDLFWPPAGVPEGAQGCPECGEGWADLLDRACQRIRAALSEGDRFHFQQIKEKYASLRIYWAGRLSPAAEGRVLDAINLAEARSACTCEVCGDEGRLYSAGGVLMTRCAEHAQGRPVEIRPGFENLLVVQRLVNGRLRTVACCRYERAADSFVDVDPAGLGIEEE
jgi:hypothetical protein